TPGRPSSTGPTGATIEVRGILLVDEALVLNGPGVNDAAGNPTGALRSTGGSATDTTWTGTVTPAGNPGVGGDEGSTVTGTGDFSGAAGLTKIGLSTFILANANPDFTGDTTLGDGTTVGTSVIRNALSLGPTQGGGAILVNSTGTLQAEGTFNMDKGLTLNG